MGVRNKKNPFHPLKNSRMYQFLHYKKIQNLMKLSVMWLMLELELFLYKKVIQLIILVRQML